MPLAIHRIFKLDTNSDVRLASLEALTGYGTCHEASQLDVDCTLRIIYYRIVCADTLILTDSVASTVRISWLWGPLSGNCREKGHAPALVAAHY